MDETLLSSKIETAKTEMKEAADHLDIVIGEIQVAPRAEKTSITEVVKDALAKLRAAKRTLDDLEELMAEKCE